jgi:hypothetical protein
MRDTSTSPRLLTLVAASTSFTLARTNTSTDTPFLSENHQFAIKSISRLVRYCIDEVLHRFQAEVVFKLFCLEYVDTSRFRTFLMAPGLSWSMFSRSTETISCGSSCVRVDSERTDDRNDEVTSMLP